MQIGDAPGAGVTIRLLGNRRAEQHASGPHDVRNGADAIVEADAMCGDEGPDVARSGAAAVRGGDAAEAASHDEMHEAEVREGGNRLAHVTFDAAAACLDDGRRHAAGKRQDAVHQSVVNLQSGSKGTTVDRFIERIKLNAVTGLLLPRGRTRRVAQHAALLSVTRAGDGSATDAI